MVDPWASETDAMREYGVTLTPFDEIHDVDCLIIAVAHDRFKTMSVDDMCAVLGETDIKNKVVADVKGVLNREEMLSRGIRYWRL